MQPSTLQMEPDGRLMDYANRWQASQGEGQNGASDDALDLNPQQRLAVMRRAYAAYRGKLPEPLKKDARRKLNLNARVNRCRPYTRVFVDLLFGKPITFEVMLPGVNDAVSELPGGGLEERPDPNSTPSATPNATDGADVARAEGTIPEEQEALEDCWTANKLPTMLKKLATNGSIFGHAFLKLVPDGVVHADKTYPRVVVIDSQLVTIETHPDDVEIVLAKNITWQGIDAQGKAIQRRQRFERTDIDAMTNTTIPLNGAERWQICNQTRTESGMVRAGGNPNAGWENTAAPEPWPYDWCPLQDCQNLPEPCSYWGGADLETDLVELNFVLNFVLSNINSIVYHHGHPKTWGRGFKKAQLSLGHDDVMIIDSPTGELQNLEMHGNLTELLAFADEIREYMDEMAGIPGFAQGRMKDVPRGQMSGVALEMYYQAPLQRTYDKRELYGDLLERVCSYLLEMMGKEAGLEVATNWPTILPRDMAQFAQVAPVLQGIGVSDTTLIREAGYDPDEEAQKKANESQQNVNVGQALMQQFNAGPAANDPNNPYGQQPGQPGQPNQPPAGNLNHPAMQAARVAASQAAATQGGQ